MAIKSFIIVDPLIVVYNDAFIFHTIYVCKLQGTKIHATL